MQSTYSIDKAFSHKITFYTDKKVLLIFVSMHENFFLSKSSTFVGHFQIVLFLSLRAKSSTSSTVPMIISNTCQLTIY